MEKQEFIEKETLNFKEQIDPECIRQQNTEQQEKELALNTVIKDYFKNKEKLDYFKEIVDIDNKAVKAKMKELNIQNFETDNGLAAKITVQNRDSLDEEKAIEKLKNLGITLPIKTKEYIDMEELENQIYLGNLNANELIDCQIKKSVTVLNVKENK